MSIDMLDKIAELKLLQSNARRQIEDYKSKILESETVLINARLEIEKLNNEIRFEANAKVNYDLTDKQKDVARFKKVLPEILESIKDEKL